MKYLPLVAIALCFAACSSPQKKADNADSLAAGIAKKDTVQATNTPAPKIESYTFLHTDGNKNQDSTRVEFTVVGEKVQGLMDWFPYEKDARSGVIEGTLKNDTIKAVWSYDQERQKDTIAVEFLLKSPTDLRQKPLVANMKNGRQQTDVKAGYTVLYKPSNRNHH